jgi:hypothetical protein
VSYYTNSLELGQSNGPVFALYIFRNCHWLPHRSTLAVTDDRLGYHACYSGFRLLWFFIVTSIARYDLPSVQTGTSSTTILAWADIAAIWDGAAAQREAKS